MVACHDAITLPCVADDPVNGASFLSCVEHFLLPNVKSRRHLYNLGSIRSDAVPESGQVRRRTAYLFAATQSGPRYRPNKTLRS